MLPNNLMSKAEDFAEKFFNVTRIYLPHVARICLIGTFLEDGIRSLFEWDLQAQYIESLWKFGDFLAAFFIFAITLGELACCVLILLKKFVQKACMALLALIGLKILLYRVFLYVDFFVRNLALGGGLMLLLAELYSENKTMFAGVPTVRERSPKQYMQLGGRILLVLMFLSLFPMELAFTSVLQICVQSVLMILIIIGYKTKIAALVLVIFLFIMNVYFNCFWTITNQAAYREFVRYNFFQTMSVIGGLLFVVLNGPGGFSIDEKKND